MRLPTSAVHYGSMVLHNFINNCSNYTLRNLAKHIVRDPALAAQFGRWVVSLYVGTIGSLTTTDIERMVRSYGR